VAFEIRRGTLTQHISAKLSRAAHNTQNTPARSLSAWHRMQARAQPPPQNIFPFTRSPLAAAAVCATSSRHHHQTFILLSAAHELQRQNYVHLFGTFVLYSLCAARREKRRRERERPPLSGSLSCV
jgi:hypothetical protein